VLNAAPAMQQVLHRTDAVAMAQVVFFGRESPYFACRNLAKLSTSQCPAAIAEQPIANCQFSALQSIIAG
jgi:hypothetical protein